jgi:hypothetical protein
MPDRVVRRVIKLGKVCKQKRSKERLNFLNRHKERFSWDNEELDEPELIEKTQERDTDQILAEIPGVLLESDYDQVVESTPDASEVDHALEAQANANLNTNTHVDDEVTGVNLPPPIVSDDEDFDDDGDDDSEVEILGDNLDNGKKVEVVDLAVDDGDYGADDDDSSAGGVLSDVEDEDEDEDEPVPQLRRSTRDRKIRNPLTFDFSNRAYQLQDSVLHINPAVIQETKEDLKISSPITTTGVPTPDPKIAIVSPRTAGINPSALARLGLPPTEDDCYVEDHVVMHVLGVILAEQYSVNKGIKLFGDRAKESVTKELKQLHDYGTYTPVHAHELTSEQRKEALASLIFITEKRCGRIKSRACVNGSTQRTYIPKENTASPTVMNDSVMITSAIDAHENRKVVTCDIPGAFLHADLDEEVVMLLRGQLADLMVMVDPELYGPYLVDRHEQNQQCE